MNKRIVRIVQELSRAQTSSSLASLANRFGVSQRTIRNDLNALNVFLHKESLGEVALGPRGIIILPDDFSVASKLLPVEDTFAYKMSSAERVELGSVLLVASPDYLTLGSIADLFSVSRATILNDLDAIKQAVSDARMEVESKPSHGLRVLGKESDKRLYLSSFLGHQAPVVDQWLSMPQNRSISDDLRIVKKVLNEQLRACGTQLPDEPFNIVANHLVIDVYRTRQGFCLEPLGQSFRGCTRDQIIAFEHNSVQLIAQYCNVPMGVDEELFLAGMGQNVSHRAKTQFNAETIHVQSLTRRFIGEIAASLSINLNDDYTLFEYLSSHLAWMFTTEQSHFPDNPELSYVVREQPEVMTAVKEHADILEAYANRKMTSTEMLYVALHICAALERRKGRRTPVRVIVACNAGVATSQLLAEQIRSRFDVLITQIIPTHELAYVKPGDADLIVSTVPTGESSLLNCIVIKFPPGDADYHLIREKLSELQAASTNTRDEDETPNAQGLLARIEPIIQARVADTDLINQVRVEVRRYFHEAENAEDEVATPYLHQLLPPSHIRLDVPCTDWRDAIRKAAQPLLELGYISERYPEEMIASIERYGPYIILAPGFAVPHTAPEGGALKTGMSLVRLANKVPFGSEENDPIEFVCVLSAVDRKTHLKAFASLVDMLAMPDSAFVSGLQKVHSSMEAARLVERCEFVVTR